MRFVLLLLILVSAFSPSTAFALAGFQAKDAVYEKDVLSDEDRLRIAKKLSEMTPAEFARNELQQKKDRFKLGLEVTSNKINELNSDIKKAHSELIKSQQSINKASLSKHDLANKLIGVKDKLVDLVRRKSYLEEVLRILIRDLYDDTRVPLLFRVVYGEEGFAVKHLDWVDRITGFASSLLREYYQMFDKRIAWAKDITKLENKYTDLIINNKDKLHKTLQGQQQTLNTLAKLKNDQDMYQKLLLDNEVKLKKFTREMQNAKVDFSELARRDLDSELKDLLFTKRKQKFSWPVPSSGGISAGYLDPSYRKTFGLPHKAIDIRVRQGSEVHAAGRGYVYKIRDAGLGYSYVILAHSRGISTLYGHLSKIIVKTGDIVERGEMIGLSGGTPGTRGSGPLTTGAHLHFEVRVEGVHFNPLKFLEQA